MPEQERCAVITYPMVKKMIEQQGKHKDICSHTCLFT